MNRTGLIIALVIAVVTGVLFALVPDLDVAISRRFYETEVGFPASLHNALTYLRHGSMGLVTLIVAVPIYALAAKLIRPHRPLAIRGRAIVFLLVTIILAPLITTNMVLKDNWGRPRPRDISTFGGTETFRPWWDPRGPCVANCSFVAGEASGAFWTLAPSALAPPPWRAAAYGAAIVFGSLTGLLRIAFGGHFFSDVVFAGVTTFLVIWLVHGALYRWRRGLVTDERIERGIEKIAERMRAIFAWRTRSTSGTKPGAAGDAPR